jgi:hypothetical protein
MLQVSPDIVDRAIAIIGTDGISEPEIESTILSLAQDPMLARRLIDLLPEAFALVFLPHLANVNLPTTFSARSRSGKWKEFDLQLEPIFSIAVHTGMEMYHSGPRNTFKNVVLRSSLVDAVNKALSQGASLDGATLSGPALNGVPAEIYLPKPISLWARLFQ